MGNLVADLRAITGPAHVLAEPDVVAGYATDWTRRYTGPATCVVSPESTAQVTELVQACAGYGARVVPQGGNTGLVGGSIPPPRSDGADCVILSTRRLTGMEPVDPRSRQVTAGAGVTIASLAAHAAAAGLRYGVDLASRDSATVGGTIATNAGGIHTIRYGPTRSQVAGVIAVLADGSVVGGLSGLTVGNTGYDFAQLLTGSEGTLGVITEARLALRPAEPATAVLLAGTPGIGAATELLGQIRLAIPDLLAAEYVDAAGLALVREVAGLAAPTTEYHHGYLLAEIGGDADTYIQRLDTVSLPADTVVAQDTNGMAALWAYREGVTEAIATTGIPHKIDVAVPVPQLGAFCDELDGVVREAAGGQGNSEPSVIAFGHLGVGNLHVNVLGLDPSDVSTDEAVARLAAAHGGSAAAEHGVGRAKTGWLAFSRSAAEIDAMRSIKAALDPAGLLNPGVLFPQPAVLPIRILH
ncbi:MAG: FAD-binding oxidoreductase [Nocardiopsaceae bacterium]|jgi:FAD/FMN-containing dehydrogenase|nr:FAD-binding oxidoreductase [Nocardiopsaceae bacterium]